MSGSFSILCDIDGVLRRGGRALPGAARFVSDLRRSGRKFLFLTNSPDHSPRELQGRFAELGMDVEEASFYTAAEAVAEFVSRSVRRARVFAVGSRALKRALAASGATLTDRRPHFVVVAGGGRYGIEELNTAVDLVLKGGRLIAANAEDQSLTRMGRGAGSGALVAPVERAAHCRAYVVGKPNHLMIRAAESRLGLEPRRTLVIGDRLDTDVDVGLQAQMKTALVLTGVTTREDLMKSPFRPDYVFPGIGDVRLEELP